jgi:Fe/S biogenesis protein NfuA
MSTDAETTTTGSDTTDADGVVLEVTPEALETILGIRDQEDDADTLALRVAITGINGADYAYDLGFEPADDATDTDHVRTQGGLTVIVPDDSIDRLRGAVLDLPARPGQAGLVIRNPNRPNPLLGVELELTGDLAEKVQQLLAEAINPSLASHGGYTNLVGVEGTKVFLSMGGGCQGCALSAATLREGIQTAIMEAIPEVTEIIDVTDHDAGENPYY